jgi:hypothetical protein
MDSNPWFSAVLLAWMALIAVLVLAFAYRLGWGARMNKTPMLVKVGGLLLLRAVLVLGLVAGVIGLFALAIHVARAFKQMPDQTAPPKKAR